MKISHKQSELSKLKKRQNCEPSPLKELKYWGFKSSMGRNVQDQENLKPYNFGSFSYFSWQDFVKISNENQKTIKIDIWTNQSNTEISLLVSLV